MPTLKSLSIKGPSATRCHMGINITIVSFIDFLRQKIQLLPLVTLQAAT